MLTQQQKSSIKNLMQGPAWPALKQLQEELCTKLLNEPKSRDTEWETIRTTLSMEGQVQGIKRFFQEMDNAALTSDHDK